MNTNLNLANEIITQQTHKKKYVIIELWANTKVATTLKQIWWASNMEFLSTSLYDKDTQVWNDAWYSSVSQEFIAAWLNHFQSLYPNQNIFINSFQTKESNYEAVTHWWIWMIHNNEKSLYHITIPDHLDRIAYQEIIANIWLQLITQCLDPKFHVTTPYIDHVYDSEQQNIMKTIDLMQHDSVVCITQEWKLCRIEDLTRTRKWYQPIIIYKWSFNPPHNGHLHIMESMQKKYPNHRAFFCISVNNFDKWDILSDEIQQRIVMINTLWYPVLLFWSALFKDNLDRLRLKNDKEIIFPVWSDTVERIFKTYNDKNQMINDFERVRFESFWREQFQFDSCQYEELFIQNDENPYSWVSSSSIIKNITKNLHNIPEKIHDLCIKKYWH